MPHDWKLPAASLGVGFLTFAVLPFGEAHNEAKHDAECHVRRDPLPLADCNDEPSLPHNRTIYVTAINSALSTSTSTSISVTFDPEHVQPIDLLSPTPVRYLWKPRST